MMSIRADEAERLAELLREIFALSKTNGPNHSKSAAADDSIKLVDTQLARALKEQAPRLKAQDPDIPGERTGSSS
jgi:hypothetical protein